MFYFYQNIKNDNRGKIEMLNLLRATNTLWAYTVFEFFEIALRHRCFPVNLLHIFRAPFLKNTSGWLLLYIYVHLNGLNQALML